ncbi:MAG: Ku protein [candidate division KSB1 bacterium]|nr:Ku protein [candidate division KSB1 bacterium]MDZ7304507.1 Ku protein [candidate division KSB1 bacterium]MDZ7313887.1 Ku protein [candidate division KSB1 bacterium]
MRALWNGRLQFSLFDIPVRIYSATQSVEVTFNSLHAPCLSRIKLEKRCPLHGPVLDEEVVKGYEYESGKFVPVTEEDLEKVNPEADHALTLLQFVEKDALDPLHFDTSYYMAPDGPLAAEVYATLRESIRHSGKYGIGKIFMRRRESLVALWVKDNAIVVSTLRYANELRNTELIGELNGLKSKNKQEIKMAEELIARHSKKLRLKSFKDSYQERLLAMLKDKVAQVKKVEQPPAEASVPLSAEAPPVTETGVEPRTEVSPAKRKMVKAPLPAKAEKKRKIA